MLGNRPDAVPALSQHWLSVPLSVLGDMDDRLTLAIIRYVSTSVTGKNTYRITEHWTYHDTESQYPHIYQYIKR